MMMRKSLGVSALVLLAAIAIGEGFFQGGRERPKIASSEKLQLPGAVLQVDFGEGRFDVGNEAVLSYVRNAAVAVSTYFGRFPVAQARVVVLPGADSFRGRRGAIAEGWTR